MEFFELGVTRKHKKEVECEVSAPRMTKIKNSAPYNLFSFSFEDLKLSHSSVFPFLGSALGDSEMIPFYFSLGTHGRVQNRLKR